MMNEGFSNPMNLLNNKVSAFEVSHHTDFQPFTVKVPATRLTA